MYGSLQLGTTEIEARIVKMTSLNSIRRSQALRSFTTLMNIDPIHEVGDPRSWILGELQVAHSS